MQTARAGTASRETFATWPAVAAWGGGLIQVALGAGALTDPVGSVSLRAAGIVLLVMGIAGIVWGALLLVRGRAAAPRFAVAGALTGVLVTVGGFVVDPVRMSVLAVAPGVLLVAVAGVGAAVAMRMPQPGDRSARPRLVELLVGAVIAAAIVTPALAATEAAYLAPADGEPVVVVDPGHRH